MLATVLTVAGVLFVLACATAFLVLVVQDLRTGRREQLEPPGPDARRSRAAHDQSEARRRINRGARGGGGL